MFAENNICVKIVRKTELYCSCWTAVNAEKGSHQTPVFSEDVLETTYNLTMLS